MLEKYGLHFEFHGFPTQLKDLRVLATKYSKLQFVINHSGLLIDFEPEEYNLWKKEVKALGEFPNVYMKISGIHMVHHNLEQQQLQSVVDQLIDAFTIEKVMFASNYPIDKAVISYDELYTAFKTTVANRSEADQEKLFYGNAIKFYRLAENEQ